MNIVCYSLQHIDVFKFLVAKSTPVKYFPKLLRNPLHKIIIIVKMLQ